MQLNILTPQGLGSGFPGEGSRLGRASTGIPRRTCARAQLPGAPLAGPPVQLPAPTSTVSDAPPCPQPTLTRPPHHSSREDPPASQSSCSLMYTHTRMCTYTRTQACTHTQRACVRVHTHARTHIHAYTHMHTHACVHPRAHACARRHTHTQVDTPVPTSAVRLSLFQLPPACAAR